MNENKNGDKCICCNTPTLKPYRDNGLYCSNCFSVFVINTPSEEELNKYYSSSEFESNYFGGGREEGAKERQMQYAQKYFYYINKFANGKKVMDIGSANNPLPNILYDNKYDITVVDFQKANSLYDQVKFIRSSAENITSEEKNDVTSSFAVIEHTRRPTLALKNMVDLTKKSGKIIIYIPEIGQFFDNYSLGTNLWFCPPIHLNLLSKKGLTSIMAGYNCKLIHDSRFELNWYRFIARYGIGLVEGLVGYFFYVFNRNFWNKKRQTRLSKYKGMRIFVFEKN